MNETDINALGKEFDVRDLIIETPEKDTQKFIKENASKINVETWEDKRSQSELITRQGRYLKQSKISKIPGIKV